MKKPILLTAITLTMGTLLYTSCKKSDDPEPVATVTPTPTPAPAPAPTLYTRVGGSTMVSDPKMSGTMLEQGRLTLRSVVDSSILVIAADPQMAQYFPVLFAELGANNTSGLTALSKNFTDFMCSATGCTNAAYAYGGKSMAAAHNPASHNRIAVKVNAADFDKFVGDIGTGLAQNGVTAANNAELVTDLVALLNTTKADIVQR